MNENFYNMGLIDKNKLLEELEKLKQNLSASPIVVIEDVKSLVERFEEKEVTDWKTDWCPSNKQIESLHELLKYNIGVFDYQKFMDVQSLYDDLIKEVDLSNSFDAIICKIGNTYLKEMDRDAIAKALEPYKNGDKVKVIIKAQKRE